MADLEEIMAGREAAPETQAPEQNRDEGGRFAEGERQPEAVPQPQAPTEPEAPERQQMVPHQALHAAREEAKGYREKFGTLESRFNDLERQNQQLVQMLRQPQQPAQPTQPTKPEAPPPDWYENPTGAAQHAFRESFTPFEERYAKDRESYDQQRQQDFQDRIALSQAIASIKFGDEVAQQAETWLDSTLRANPAMAPVFQQMIFGPGKLPGVEVVKLYQGQSPLGQPQGMQSLVEAEVSRRLAEMGHQPAPQQQAAPQPPTAAPQTMPTSFATARNGGPRSAPQATGARSLSEIMGR